MALHCVNLAKLELIPGKIPFPIGFHVRISHDRDLCENWEAEEE